ncbi:MAG: ParB/RepB/Spo0J family partition protein [Opitutales bacterium]|nr:ParB/RepB/Spo0J family partition protein [Opitutales bacterium]MCH8541790.1 ParB/RepB/Spo0J family partition protein [Opitutales bacterium]
MTTKKTRLGRGLGGLLAGGGKSSKSSTPASRSSPERSSGSPKKAPRRSTTAKKSVSAKKSSSPPKKAPRQEKPEALLPGFQEIAVSQIVPSPYQPRQQIAEEALHELSESIRSEGLLQPIVVRPSGKQFELIAGERRWRACQRLRLASISARVMEVSDASAASLALIENLQREGLDPIEEAHGYLSLLEDFDLTQEAVAERVGKARTSVANALRLLRLEPELQSFVSKGLLSIGHAKLLLGVEEPESRLLLGRRVIEEGLSVRALEKALQARKNGGATRFSGGSSTNPVESTAVQALERDLASRLSAPVKLQHTAKKGKLIIEYRGNDDLQRILEKMGLAQ